MPQMRQVFVLKKEKNFYITFQTIILNYNIITKYYFVLKN